MKAGLSLTHAVLQGICTVCLLGSTAGAQLAASVGGLTVHVDERTGAYAIALPGQVRAILTAGSAAQVDGKWIESSEYPEHKVQESDVNGELGSAHQWTITHSGLRGAPELICRLRAYRQLPFGDVEVSVRNTTDNTLHVEAIRVIDSAGEEAIHVDGPSAQTRVLSDSFSEDRPAMQIHELADAENGMHRGVGSQLIYNRQSRTGLFLGALTSDRFLTVLRLHVQGAGNDARPSKLEVDSTGTTELTRENSLHDSPTQDRIVLSLPLDPAANMASERILFSADGDYHRQLETYASLIRQLHHARVDAETPMGWWSWTAFYFGLNQGTALANAAWLAQHLDRFGYTYFHIDEGYQYARGEYTTPDARLFPDGMAPLEHKAASMGLTPGIWTAPFEASERSWVYQHHPEWLIHNQQGKPIEAGRVTDGTDKLYLIDPTHPGAQEYLRTTYRTMVRDWGIRYFKLDFMEDSAVEGVYHQPNTTALQAQRIGLGIIREAVGDSVLLDKDGCEMLNPVGYVDFGRISQDTGHTFDASRDAATGVAARYYMNRNYFVADPDAFTVSTQTVDDQSWHGGQNPLTLDEARVSIALTAVSGGMFEIGDDLPTLQSERERAALLENADLIDMARLGRSATPLDLMTYSPEDRQPSIFLLHEDARQTILSVFNWTEGARTHTFSLAELGLPADGHYEIHDVFDGKQIQLDAQQTLHLSGPAHSVRMLKIVNTAVPPAAMQLSLQKPDKGEAGEALAFTAKNASPEPVLRYSWEFGDGVSQSGSHVQHTYTHPGDYRGVLTAVGLDGRRTTQDFSMTITGSVATKFVPAEKVRLQTH